ncbi:MAG: GldL-related protein [Cyclobacteriaceae bacterium]|jgi:hypothetical protein
MTLSLEQIDQIKILVTRSEITRTDMKDDLVDHLCCSVEEKLQTGVLFQQALDRALHELVPNGFTELEIETYFLLNQKTITMKKLTYSLGLVFSVLASIGFLFKILHWTGANEMLILGLGGLVIFFLPLLVVTRGKTGAQEKLALSSLALVSIGGVLKVFRVVAANEFLLLGVAVFALAYLPVAFLAMYRKSIANS